jgi:hypothetical protein
VRLYALVFQRWERSLSALRVARVEHGGANRRERGLTMEKLIVESKVKDVIKAADLQTAGNLTEFLNEKVHALLQEAVDRCKANGRKTVRPEDL